MNEIQRQSIHLIYGVALTIACMHTPYIGVFMFIAILIARPYIRRYEREGEIPGYGSLTLTAGITSVALIMPEKLLVAGLGVAIIDSIATLAALLGEGSKKKLGASIAGGLVFFMITTSFISDISTARLFVAALVGTIAEFLTDKRFIDDNLTVVWAIALF